MGLTVLHWDTICSLGQAQPPQLPGENILKTCENIWLSNDKLVFLCEKRDIFIRNCIFVANLHFPHIRTGDPGQSSEENMSDNKICFASSESVLWLPFYLIEFLLGCFSHSILHSRIKKWTNWGFWNRTEQGCQNVQNCNWSGWRVKLHLIWILKN